jgi:ribonuclease D
MPHRPPDVVPEIVPRDLTEDQLQAFLASPYLSVDTETLGLQQLRDRLCLVQLCDASGRAVIVQVPRDQVIGSALPPESRAPRLKRVLEEPRVLKILHFARFDVAVLRHYLGIRLWPLYCTRTASKLVRTYTDRHGLKDVALELLDVEMDKVTRHSDWAAASLSPEQVRYAISDVTMLIPIMERLDEMIRREGRKELAEECFRVIPVMAELDLRGYDLLFEH